MKIINISKINLESLSDELRRHERRWVAISAQNALVAHGKTYQEAVNKAKKKRIKNIVLLKVPPLNYSLAP